MMMALHRADPKDKGKVTLAGACCGQWQSQDFPDLLESLASAPLVKAGPGFSL